MSITYRIESEDEARALFAIFNKHGYGPNPIPDIFYIAEKSYIIPGITYEEYYYQEVANNPRYVSVFASKGMEYLQFKPFDINLTLDQVEKLKNRSTNKEYSSILSKNIICKIHELTSTLKDEDVVTVQLTRVQAEALAKSLSRKYPSDFECDVINGVIPASIKNPVVKARFDIAHIHAIAYPKGKAHLHDIYQSIVKAVNV